MHIVDIPDARYDWPKGGELLLTAGLGLREDAVRRAELIPKLAEKGLAGVAFSMGHYLETVPLELRAAGDSFWSASASLQMLRISPHVS